MNQIDQWILFLGRFHPVVLHLPIGAVILVALMELVPIKSWRESISPAKLFILSVAILSAILSIITGLFLEQEGTYGAERIFWHKTFGMLMTTSLLVALYFSLKNQTRHGWANNAYRLSILASVIFLIAGSHHGGVMTHGSNFLTEHLPTKAVEEQPQVIDAMPSLSESTVVGLSPTGDVIRQYCIDCHNPNRRKGKLDLESILSMDIGEHPETWDEVIKMLESREMPPEDEPDIPRPTEEEYIQAVNWFHENHVQDIADKLPVNEDDESALSGLPALDAHCTSCHSGTEAESGLDIEKLIAQPLHHHREVWESIIRKMNARQMPPHGKSRPDNATYDATIRYLEDSMDFISLADQNPGRTSTFRRLTRAEYENAIRDLLAIEIDASELLPRDEVSHGFDNITVTGLTPTLIDRYISAARKISRTAVGSPLGFPEGKTVRIKPDVTQNSRMDGLPLGTRGGIMIPYHFPRSGTYDVEIKLTRDRNEDVEGLDKPHQIEVMLNKDLMEVFTVVPPVKGETLHRDVDKHLTLRMTVEAGLQKLGVTFTAEPEILLERRREPHQSSFNFHRHPRTSPAIYQVSITGPFEDFGAGETASRQKIFGELESTKLDQQAYAERILTRIARLAYRRPVSDDDIRPLMNFYATAQVEGGFEKGIESALSAILVNPNFLFRIERAPKELKPGDTYKISDVELASRLSFFLWSSIPDERLLSLAESNRLSDPIVLQEQVDRMLKDPRSSSLIDQFAGQWLYLRNIESVKPDLRMFPDFDDNLRQAMRHETEMLFEHVMREDKSVLELITADYTFLNERIAKHYGVPGVYGTRFRKVALAPSSARGGLLRHGSILAVTSYANRTSPVIRGAWILENIVGAPPPPPPPDVPALEETVISESLPLRDRLAAHRDNPGCISCHELMDPIGFALESFNAVGQRRFLENGLPVDASGVVADGTAFIGVEDLENYIIKYPENFVRTMVEKLLTFGLGRGIEYYDMPTVRAIVTSSRSDDYSFSSLINGIVQSRPFQNRTVL